MAVKIKLMRLGKIRQPYYRIVVADARTRRSGRAIETIGKYHPKNEPSLIEVDSDAGAVLAGRRRAAHRAGAAPARDHRRLAEVQGPARRRGHPQAAAGEGRQAGPLPGGAGRRGRGAHHRGHHAAEEGRPPPEGRGRPPRPPTKRADASRRGCRPTRRRQRRHRDASWRTRWSTSSGASSTTRTTCRSSWSPPAAAAPSRSGCTPRTSAR